MVTTERNKAQSNATRRGGDVVPTLMNVLGSTLIVAVFALTLPLVVPKLLGYQVFDVISESMEPAIPVGSVIYVREAEPSDVQVDEVIAFMDDGDVVAHRVVANRTSMGEFVTKGDANNAEDPKPVPYDELLGVVAMHVPVVGRFMSLYASTFGKVYLGLALGCGIMLNMLADAKRREASRAARQRIRENAAAAASGDAPVAARPPRRGGWLRTVFMALLALVFVGSAGVVFYVRHERKVAIEVYDAAAQTYSRKDAADSTSVPNSVDFDALRAVNPDVIGWLYCPGTNIDYPVLKGADNDVYLRHDYTGEYNINGSVFIDSENQRDFSDANTIVYGHHMNEGVMFGSLENWGDQAFYEQHPVMWLLTPTQTYQVVIVSCHHVSAYSDMYDILRGHDETFEHFLAEAVAESEIIPVEGATVNPDRNYIMLTTCSYIFDSARFVVHGKLVPVA